MINKTYIVMHCDSSKLNLLGTPINNIFNILDDGELGITSTIELSINDRDNKLYPYIRVLFGSTEFWYNPNSMTVLGEL